MFHLFRDIFPVSPPPYLIYCGTLKGSSLAHLRLTPDGSFLASPLSSQALFILKGQSMGTTSRKLYLLRHKL